MDRVTFEALLASVNYKSGGSYFSNKVPFPDMRLTEALTDSEPEVEPQHLVGYVTDVVSGEVFKMNGERILEPGEEKAAKRFRHVFRVERIGSELTAEEIRQNQALVNRAKQKELLGLMKYDAMQPVKKNQCQTRPITSRWVLTWKIIDGKKDVKARLVLSLIHI